MIPQAAIKSYLSSLMAPTLVAMGLAFSRLHESMTAQMTSLTTQMSNKANQSALTVVLNGADIAPAGTPVTDLAYTADLAAGAAQRLVIGRSTLTLNVPTLPAPLTTGKLELYLSTTAPTCILARGAGLYFAPNANTALTSGETWLCTIHVLAANNAIAEMRRLA